MIEIRIHGRGGQGAVTASQILAISAFHDGKWTQAFPNFGVERRGAPTEAFVRIDDEKINLRTHVYNPDIVLVLDASLLNTVDITKGLKKNGKIIINSEKDPSSFKFKEAFEVHTSDANEVSNRIFKRNIVNTPLLGAFAAATKLITLESLFKGIEEKFNGNQKLIDSNQQVIKEVYEKCK